MYLQGEFDASSLKVSRGVNPSPVNMQLTRRSLNCGSFPCITACTTLVTPTDSSGLLLQYGVPFAASAKKADLVNSFEQEIRPQAAVRYFAAHTTATDLRHCCRAHLASSPAIPVSSMSLQMGRSLSPRLVRNEAEGDPGRRSLNRSRRHPKSRRKMTPSKSSRSRRNHQSSGREAGPVRLSSSPKRLRPSRQSRQRRGAGRARQRIQ